MSPIYCIAKATISTTHHPHPLQDPTTTGREKRYVILPDEEIKNLRLLNDVYNKYVIFFLPLS